METARALLGAPFLHQGRSAHGTDCAGLALMVARTHGLMLGADLRADYGLLPQRLLRETMEKLCGAPIARARRGCIVLIRWHGTAYAQHIAICAGDTLIHCCGLHRRVIEHGYRGQWLIQTDSSWWIPGVAFE